MNRADQIANLERQLADLKKKNRQSEAALLMRKKRLEHAESVQQRKLETRRKILIGEAFLRDMQSDPNLHDWFYNRFLTHHVNDRCRHLFRDFLAAGKAADKPNRSLFSQLPHWLDRIASLTRPVPSERRSS